MTARVVAAAGIAAVVGLGSGVAGVAGTALAVGENPADAPPPAAGMVIAVVVPPHDRGVVTPSPSVSAPPSGGAGGTGGAAGAAHPGAAEGDLAATGDQLTGALVFAGLAVGLIGAGVALRRRAAHD